MSHQDTMNQQRNRNSINHGQFQDQNLFEQQQPNFDQIQYPATINPQEFGVKRDQSPHISPDQQQFTDYPLYPESNRNSALYEDYQVPTTQAGSINPADLTLSMHGNHSPHHSQHSTPSLHINPHHSPIGSNAYLSTSSTQPSATGVDWDQIPTHQESWNTHRRAPSEYSEISSAAPSPYLAHQEFGDSPSPLLQGQNMNQQRHSMQDLLNAGGPETFLDLEGFNLSERDHSPSMSPSPAGHHSSSNSPYILPQDNQLLGMVPSMGDSGMHPMHPPAGHGSGGLGIHRAPDDEHFPQINVTFAPPQRQPTFPGRPGLDADNSALSPPPKSPARRQRSKSDPYANGGLPDRRTGSGSGANSRSSSPHRHSRRNSLSPADILTAPVGRPTSQPPSSATKMSRRSSTNSLPNREAILDLAHPHRPGAAPGENKRVQKHAATFQCHLCPKKFTRAYNLRSHLRTHTDERPFVCTVCSKAFARQHDRKRHEGLHSGEKKFVCKGQLKVGGSWGCSRRFARADALGRHFRSEAGRVCIRPLLDEETAERQQRGLQMGMEMHAAPPGGVHPGIDAATMGMAFPSALLEQYPALATVNWSVLPMPGEDDEGYEDVASGRSSFDAGRDYEDGGLGSHRNSYDGSGWASDTGPELGYVQR